jgi:hypothetical protein
VTERERLKQVIDVLPDDRVREVLDFARFLESLDEEEAWRAFGREQLARAYGPDEPEYTSPVARDLLPAPHLAVDPSKGCNDLPGRVHVIPRITGATESGSKDCFGNGILVALERRLITTE